MRVVIGSYLIFALCFDIACYKYRHLAQFLLYFESVIALLYTLVPSVLYLTMTTFFMTTLYFLLFLGFYCDSGYQLVFHTLSLAIQIFGVRLYAYEADDGYLDIGRNVLLILLLFVGQASSAILTKYIVDLNQKRTNSMLANIKLLDGMHEGLLILSKSTLSTMFMNYAAKKLIKNFIAAKEDLEKSNNF